MPYHVKKPSLVNKDITVYYRGDRRWSDSFSERLIFDEDPTSLFTNPDGTNGGWSGAEVVVE